MGNWRGQLTMIDSSKAGEGRQPELSSALVTYASPKGLLPPALLLTEGADSDILKVNCPNITWTCLNNSIISRYVPLDGTSNHMLRLQNLRENGLVSLTIGRTDPPVTLSSFEETCACPQRKQVSRATRD